MIHQRVVVAVVDKKGLPFETPDKIKGEKIESDEKRIDKVKRLRLDH